MKLTTQSVLPSELARIGFMGKAAKRIKSSLCKLYRHSQCSGMRNGSDRKRHVCECLCHKRNAVETDPNL